VGTSLSRADLAPSKAIHVLYRQNRLRRKLPFKARIPNELTTRTLRATKAGKDVKHFKNKKDLYKDLGL
jgi:antitoxin component of RelBE/YafQ-DinJ toxin-antitoxin module